MTVSNSWLVDVNVAINTTVVQAPAFNYCALLGIMPTQSSPYTSPPASWNGAGYNTYTSLASFTSDFTPLLTGAITASDPFSANRFQWLINAATAFFAQNPTPSELYVFGTSGPVTNYGTVFNTMTTANNSWYGFSICDLILASSYSTCVVQLTTSSSVTIPAGTVVTPKTATSYYTLLQSYNLSSGVTPLVFYSSDGSTSVASSTFTAISPTLSAVTNVTNTVAAVTGHPGYTTTSTGVNAGLASLRSASNQKKLFADFNDNTQAGLIQAGSNSKDLTCFFHSLNLQSYTVTSAASLSAACLGAYFTPLFLNNNGLTVLSSEQLSGQPIDTTITTANIGTPGQAGSSTNLIGWNNNVYAGFGAPPGIGLVQYGYQSSSVPGEQVYLDQVVGADYIQFTTQANLVTLILNAQPSGILYNDFGIQQIVNNFKASLNNAVAQNIIQPFSNSDFTYTNFANVSSTDITNRIYQDLSFSGVFLNRIQRISVGVNLSL